MKINVIQLNTINSAKLGYLINIIRIPKIVNFIIREFEVPESVWCYNAYSIEMNIGAYINKNYGSKFILEFEDWHFARKRGLNIKPILDWVFWRRNLKYISYGFSVNNNLQNKFEKNKISSELLPGVISRSIINISINNKPFKINKSKITVGYFGGLSSEKGADFLLKIIKKSSENKLPLTFIVTGKGALEKKYSELSKFQPEYLQYYGAVEESNLIEYISKTDVIVNPHDVNFGVFPFKVLEALSSGRLLISTNLSLDNNMNWLKNAIVICDKNIDIFINELLKSYQSYQYKKESIEYAINIINENYTENSFTNRLMKVLK